MGFCSAACVAHAKQDLLIKDFARDAFDYQGLRQEVEKKTISLAEAQARVVAHLDKELEHVHFNHATSQKEELVDQALIQEYWGA